MFGVDYSESVTSLKTLVSLRRGDVHFCMRYISTPRNPKNLTVPEKKALRAAGMLIGIIFETTAARALSGSLGGRADGVSAWAQINALGMRDAIVFFTVDDNVTADQLPTVGNYFRAVNGVMGRELATGKRRGGAYGDDAVIKYLFDHDLIDFGYQTYAWSDDKWDPRAQIQQYRNGVTLYGIDVDYNRTTAVDFGQWPRPKPPTPPPVKTDTKPMPAPKPAPTPPPDPPDPTSHPGWPVWAYAFAAWLRKLVIH